MEHQFCIELASSYGIEEAIIIHNLYFWIKKNVANGSNFHDGRYWTYNSSKAFSILFPYMTESKIYRVLKSLEEKGLIVKGNYNDTKYDRTTWYSLSDKALEELNVLKYDTNGFSESILRKEEKDFAKMQNGIYESEEPIPYSKHTDSNTDKKEDTNVSKKDKDLLFEECWKLYNRKGSKGKSKPYWDKLTIEEMQLAKSHIQAYVQSVSERKYQKDFERYLRDKIFKDVVYKGNMIIFDPERENNTDNEYRPQLDGFNLHWNEQVKCYISMYDIDMLFDGYTAENRPSSAMVMKGGIRYKWNTQTKKWEVQ